MVSRLIIVIVFWCSLKFYHFVWKHLFWDGVVFERFFSTIAKIYYKSTQTMLTVPVIRSKELCRMRNIVGTWPIIEQQILSNFSCLSGKFQNAVHVKKYPLTMPPIALSRTLALLAMTKNRFAPSVDFLVLYSFISKWKFVGICLQLWLLIFPFPVLNTDSCHCQSIACANRGWRLAVNGSIVDRVCIIIVIQYKHKCQCGYSLLHMPQNSKSHPKDIV